MFRTALITRKYPVEIGLENDPEDPWYAHLYYPLIKSKKEGVNFLKDFKNNLIKQKRLFEKNSPTENTYGVPAG